MTSKSGNDSKEKTLAARVARLELQNAELRKEIESLSGGARLAKFSQTDTFEKIKALQPLVDDMKLLKGLQVELCDKVRDLEARSGGGRSGAPTQAEIVDRVKKVERRVTQLEKVTRKQPWHRRIILPALYLFANWYLWKIYDTGYYEYYYVNP